MAQYIVRRLLFFIPVALLVCFLVFVISALTPGDPVLVRLGEEATPELAAALRKELGLDQPITTQFGIWLTQVLQGNFGKSIQLDQPVLDAIIERLPVTLELGISSLLFSLVVAVPLGIYSATHRLGWLDWLINVFGLLGLAIPTFVFGLVFILVFAVFIPIFPPGGFTPFEEDPGRNLHSLILPMLTLGIGGVAANMRQIRASMIEVLSQDYIRTAWSKGLPRNRVHYVHALRNAIIPLLTLIGLQIGAILAGAVVVETIFLWPGVGQFAVNSILSKDFPVIQGVVLISAFSYMGANLLVDVSYVAFDPRIRFDKAQ